MWPENWPACMLFDDVSTQWRTSFAGPTGLDYAVLFARMGMLDLSASERESMFHDIRYMERQALDLMRADE